jgi:hypothetical protein
MCGPAQNSKWRCARQTMPIEKIMAKLRPIFLSQGEFCFGFRV